MSAFDNQLQAALARLSDTNPMFDFSAANEDTRYRQLKTWWGRPLAEDVRSGHDTSGPITAPEDLSDRQSVLLSFLQRPLRAGRSGDWSITAEPAPEDGLHLVASGYGFTLSAAVAEVNGVVLRKVDSSAESGDGTWPARMVYRSTYLEAPAADLIDALALGAALHRSPFAALAQQISRSSADTIEAPDLDIYLDWTALEAIPDGDIEGLSAAAGITPEQVRPALTAVLHRAIELGHPVPGLRPSDAPLPDPVPAAVPAGGVELPEGHPARAVLDSMGIDLSGTKVIGIGPGSSGGIGIGVGANGGLTITDLPGLGAPAGPTYEEEIMAECAKVLGISTEEFRAIIDEDDNDGE